MKFACILALLIVGPAGTAETQQEFAQNILAFEIPHDKFVRAFFGCPADPSIPISITTCRPSTGKTDYKSYTEARRAAMRLYDLKD